jgi:hypothetical protein
MADANDVAEVHSSGLDVPFKYFIRPIVEQNRWQANSYSTDQEVTYILWNFDVSCIVYESPSLVLILRQLGPIHTLSFHFLRSVLILSSHLCLGLPQQSVFYRIFHQNPIWTHFHGCQLLVHLIILDFITLIIFCENYKLWTASLCIFFHPPITAALSDQNIYNQNPFPDLCISVLFAHYKRPSLTSIRNRRKTYSFVYFIRYVTT